MSWGKEIKYEACRAFYLFFAMSLINSIIQEHEFRFNLSYDIKNTLKFHFWPKNIIILSLRRNVVMDFITFPVNL